MTMLAVALGGAALREKKARGVGPIGSTNQLFLRESVGQLPAGKVTQLISSDQVVQWLVTVVPL